MIRSSGLLVLTLLCGCATVPPPVADVAPPLVAPIVVAVPSQAEEDVRFNSFIDGAFDQRIALNPLFLTAIGSKERYDELGDYTPAFDARYTALVAKQLADMRRTFDPSKLGPAAAISFRMAEYNDEQTLAQAKWRDHGFIFTALGSPAGQLPTTLINNHRVDTVADAEAYVARLTAIDRAGAEIAADFEARAAKGLVPPSFIFGPAIADANNVIGGAPFGAGADSALWTDFQAKVAKLDTDAATRTRLLDAGRAALVGPFRNGIRRLVTSLETVRPRATSTDGVWRLPDGDAFYADRVKVMTTTDLTPDRVHDIGLAEVARIRREMEPIQQQIGYKGSLQSFINHVRTSPKYAYPNSEAGKQQYLTDARKFVAQAMGAAPRFFHTLPKAPLEVRAVEKWREATAGVAFYARGTPDGSRPGIFYANLSNPSQMSLPQVEGTAYHEGAPGHHFQSSFAQEQEGLPKFRRFGGYGAYGEGWGLYSERLGKEMGFYQDPILDFGRLSMELWRAARLVVDTGVHHKRWSRAKAASYLRDNSLLSERDVNKEIDRYITNPGQATSYKIGELKISELRRKAERDLGPRFDVRDYHAVVLDNGSMPLAILEQQVEAYIAAKRGS